MDILQYLSCRKSEVLPEMAMISPICLHPPGLPLFLWGAGEMAELVYSWLIKNQIAVAGVFVDVPRDAVHGNEKFHGLDVCGLEDVVHKYSEFNVIAGHARGYEMKDDLKRRHKNIKNVYSFYMGVLLGLEPMPYDFIVENKNAFEWTYDQFSDELSRSSYLAYLNAKINSSGWELAPYVRDNEYFCEEIIKLSPNEVFVDCGAYDGDSITSFLRHLSSRSIQGYSAIYALEPDKTNYEKLRSKVGQMTNLHCLNKGVWNEVTTLHFDSMSSMASHVQEAGETVIEADTIDNLLSGNRASLIKMDIEGAELEALKGARRTISQYKPKLAICAYHRASDLIRLPQYIKSLVPEYKLFFRIHKCGTVDSVLYAVCDDGSFGP